MSRLQAHFYIVALALIAGCSGSGEGLDENGRPVAPSDSEPVAIAPTIIDIQRDVFTPTCAVSGCHAGSRAPLGLDLSEGLAFDNLVNQLSVQQADILRVAPGDPDNSYLIQKLEGTAESGLRMPRNQPPLPTDTIATIREWIARGAMLSSSVGSAQ